MRTFLIAWLEMVCGCFMALKSISKGIVKGFKSRVSAAARAGGLSKADAGRLDKILDSQEHRGHIVAAGTSSTLSIANLTSTELGSLNNLFALAHNNLQAGREPFTREMLAQLEHILSKKVSFDAIKRIEFDLARSDEATLVPLSKNLAQLNVRVSLSSTPKRSD